MSKYTKKRDIIGLYILMAILVVLCPPAAIIVLVIIGHESRQEKANEKTTPR